MLLLLAACRSADPETRRERTPPDSVSNPFPATHAPGADGAPPTAGDAERTADVTEESLEPDVAGADGGPAEQARIVMLLGQLEITALTAR